MGDDSNPNSICWVAEGEERASSGSGCPDGSEKVEQKMMG